ncbi:MAG: FAD-dependent monooxygenase [Rhizobiaceae bacterium]
MVSLENRRILISGGGIAGLTAALAFAQRGFTVDVFERAETLQEIGAGLQLSPNATNILGKLGVLDNLASMAVRPDAVVIRRATSLAEVARVPLGDFAEQRWGAPYLVAHRSDLQQALLATVAANPQIHLTTGVSVRDFALSDDRATLSIEHAGERHEEHGLLAIGADGVWSAIRGLAGEVGISRFIGQLAWRRTLVEGEDDFAAFQAACPGTVVTAFLHPGFHLIAYPLRAGKAINLVAFTRTKRELKADWHVTADTGPLRAAMRQVHPALSGLAAPGKAWTAWPIHVADPDGAWVDPAGLALIGDAAHAMTPFAAQGAAMAIEDAETLADVVTPALQADRGLLPGALNDWAVARRRRVLRVARRGALNQFAWHARGLVASARDLFMRGRGPEKLASDLDWLYGWRPD